MKADLANPFISAAVGVFQKEIGVKLTRRDLKLKDSPVPGQAISIIIGVTGPVKCQVVYAMDDNFAFAVAKSMLPGKLPAEIKKFINSSIAEMANMITGAASITLAGENKKIDITTPAVFTGPGVRMDFLNLPTICLSFISEIGSFELNIALTED